MQSRLEKVPQKFQRSFNICIDMAESNPHQYKFCCIALNKKGNIIGMSYQREDKTHPLQYYYAKQTQQPYKIFLHAEIATLIKAKNPYALFVARVDKNGTLVTSKPCPICQLALKNTSSLKHIYYTDDNKVFKFTL